jgi:hypothetical protein
LFYKRKLSVQEARPKAIKENPNKKIVEENTGKSKKIRSKQRTRIVQK